MSNKNLISSLRSILDKKKMNEHNFLNWERNQRIVLRSENQEDVLEHQIPEFTLDSSDEDHATYTEDKK